MNAIVETITSGALATTEKVPAPPNLIQLAIQHGAKVDELRALMELQRDWEREQARKAYHSARARFQAACPEIKRDREVDAGKYKYRYATLAGIVEQVRAPLSNCGLTYRWEIDDSPDSIKVTCVLSHVDGHSEHNTMSALPDDSGAKNAIQQRGSTVTYLQRYTLIGVLGIASANDDDDGRSSGALNVEALRKHNDALREWWESIATIKTAIREQSLLPAIEAWAEMDDDTRRALWLAPSKGGIFTTEERRVMHSDEWAAERRVMMGEINASSDPSPAAQG